MHIHKILFPPQRRGAFPFDKRGTKKRIAIFYGGKLSKHLKLIQKAAKKMGVDLDLVSYNKITYCINHNNQIPRNRQISKSNFQFKSPLNPLFDKEGGEHIFYFYLDFANETMRIVYIRMI